MRKIFVFILCILFLFTSPVYAAREVNGWVKNVIECVEYNNLSIPVKIAVIDTGISIGRIDSSKILQGKNYVFDNEDTTDLTGHGTAVAGLIVGASDEEENLVGIAPSAVLVPLVFYSKYSSGVPINGGVNAIVSAVYDAVDVYGCRIINISSGIIEPNINLEAAVAYAEEKGVIVVSAVGNANLTRPDRVYYPAAYSTVVGVGAIDDTLSALPVSQRNESVMVCAPGKHIRSVSIKNASFFKDITGTSYAAAYVSGMAARLLEKYPQMTPAQFRWILQNKSTDLGAPGYDTTYGYGIIRILSSLNENVYNYTTLRRSHAMDQMP